MIKTIFFDLDGTLLPMDQDVFLQDYFDQLVEKMMPQGYESQKLRKSIWFCTGAMIQNDGTQTNEELFWKSFSEIYGKDTRNDEPIFLDFYQNEFQKVRQSCGHDARAAETIRTLKENGFRLILATNPLFPAVATKSRIKWAGLDPADFEWITTYENASYCKPNPEYYREILNKLDLNPEECLMVGNDAQEDMVAKSLGMHVFLLTDCLINKHQVDITQFPNGSFPELMDYINEICI